VDSRVDDFVALVFVFDIYLIRRTSFFDQRGKLVVLVRFEDGDVEGVLYCSRVWQGQLIKACSHSCQAFQVSSFFVVQFSRWSRGLDVAC